MMTRIILTIAIAAALPAKAQQPLKNTAFKGGETLEYKMYFNWKFIWLNAGTATMKTTEGNYAGKKAYRCALTTRSSAKIDKYFRLRDTLLCYTTRDLIPLYYRKGADEGKRYYVDELFYEYNNGCHVTMKELTASGERKQKKLRCKLSVSMSEPKRISNSVTLRACWVSVLTNRRSSALMPSTMASQLACDGTHP